MTTTQQRIVVSRPLLEETATTLQGYGQLQVLDPQALIDGHPSLAGADALITQLDDLIDEETLDRLPRVRVICNYAVGVNNINLSAAEERGIWVTHTPDVLTDSTADLAFALILGSARRLGEGERLVRSGAFSGWELDLLLGEDVHHKTLGIVGYGRIGRAVARRARGFGMRVLFCAHHPVQGEHGDQQVPLETLLRESDFVSLHVPLTEETHHMINSENLRWMKRSAILVNTARGPIVDEEALVRALSARWIRAAGLDVYEQEPDLHPRLLGLDNVLLLPHLGSGTRETRLAMGKMICQDLAAVLKAQAPQHPANKPAADKLRVARN